MAMKFVMSQPALAPLFVAVGLGVAGALGFGTHYLMHNPDIQIRKNTGTEPWNRVQQGQNTKLMSFNKDFWQSRDNVPDPRAMFMEGKASGDEQKMEKAKAIMKSRKEEAAH